MNNAVSRRGLTLPNGWQPFHKRRSLTPAFSPDITAYSASVSWDTESLNITAVVEKVGNTLTINEQAAASGIPAIVSLYTGVNNITVRVTSPDGLTRTYVLLVTRPALVLSAAASAAQTQPVAGAANTITLSVKRGVDIDTSFNGEKNVTVSGYLAAPTVLRQHNVPTQVRQQQSA